MPALDADGVALAAIHGLYQKVDLENAKLRGQLERRDTANAEASSLARLTNSPIASPLASCYQTGVFSNNSDQAQLSNNSEERVRMENTGCRHQLQIFTSNVHGFVLALAIGIGLSPAARAEVKFWDGSSSGNWNVAANWTDGAVPVNGDDLVFPAGVARLNVTNDFIGRIFRSITFQGSNYAVFGNSLTLSNNTTAVSAQNPAGTNSMALALTFANPQGLECLNGPAALVLSGTLALGTNALTVNAVGRVTLAGAISGTGASSTVTKSGAGTLRFQGTASNTYGGVTTVNGGALELFKTGGTIAVPGDLVVGDGVSSALGRLLANVQIASTSDVRVNRFATLDLNGFANVIATLTMSGGTVATGTGVLILGDNVTTLASAGVATISGNLSLDTATRTFDVASGAASPDLLLSASILGAPTAGLTKSGDGQLTLSASNTFNGLTTVSDGILILDNDHALGGSGAGTNGTVVLTNAFLLAQGVDIASEVLTLNNGADFRSSGTASWAGNITLVGAPEINVFGGSFTLTGVISGTGGFVKGQTGNLIISGTSPNTFTGPVTVNTGTLSLGKPVGVRAISAAGLIIGDDVGGEDADVVRHLASTQFDGNVTIRTSGLWDLNGFNEGILSLTLEGGDVSTGTGTLSLNANLTVAVSTNSAVIDGILNLAAGTHTLDVPFNNLGPSTFDLAVNATVIGAGALTKTGAGSLLLRGTNTYTGVTTLDGGSISITEDASLGTSAGGTVLNAGILQMNSCDVTNETLTVGGSARLDSVFACTWAGNIVVNDDLSIIVGSLSSLDITGVISGAGNLTKGGTEALTLSGSSVNTHTGTTKVSGGQLLLNKSSGNAIVGLLVIGDSIGGTSADVVSLLLNNQIADSSTISITTSGLLDLNDRTDTTGAISGFGGIDLGSGSLRAGADNGSSTFYGRIVGTGTLFKFGTGTWTLAANNSYTGLTTVSAGTLVVDGSQPQSPVTVNGSATLGGSGVVGNLQVFGNLAPGTSPGTLTSSNVAFTAAGDFFVELNGPTPGTGYDQLNVRGTNQLAGSTLHAVAGPNFAPVEGEQFVILNNDGSEAIIGTFAGLPNNALFTVAGLQFHIRYSDAFGNDVVLTVTNTPLRYLSTVVRSGNYNGAIDPDECNLLDIAITNSSGSAVSGISATLVSRTPGVSVTQPFAAYPDLPVGRRGTNATTFQVSTLPGFLCGTNVQFDLVVATATNGTFTVPLSLPSGSLATTPVRFNNNTETPIPDLNTINSTVTVSGITTPIRRVTVSMHITHTAAADLDVSLIGPDGTTVILTSDNGGTASDYGTSCTDNQRTSFNDFTATSITSGTAPFVGAFQPEQSLAVFNGEFGTNVNGLWTLRVADDAGGAVGTLRCWSLFLTPTVCAPGGGSCESCPERTIFGVISDRSPMQDGRLFRNGSRNACAAAKNCPGPEVLGIQYPFNTYTSVNGESNACVTVLLESIGNLYSAAYLGSYNPSNLCQNYLGDRGLSLGTDGGTLDYSFNVPARATFVVVVVNLDSVDPLGFRLEVTGGSCRPVLANDPLTVSWSTAAIGYQLESTNTLPVLPAPAWRPEIVPPTISDGRFYWTNPASFPPSAEFFRLRKP